MGENAGSMGDSSVAKISPENYIGSRLDDQVAWYDQKG